MFVDEKLLSIVDNDYFTGGISVPKLAITLFVNREDVSKLAVTLFVNREDVSKLAVTLFVNREDKEVASSESKRTKAIGKNSKDKVCLDRHSNGHGGKSRLFGATDPVFIRAYAFGGPVSRSSRPQAHSASPKETNTYDDVSVDQRNDVFKVKTAEGSEQATSTSLNGRKKKQHKAAEGKTQVTSTPLTNRKEKQYTPYDQSAKTRNLSVTTQD